MKKTTKPAKPTSRAIWASRVNLTNSFNPNWKKHYSTEALRRIRKESIATLRAAQAHNLI